LQFLNTCAINIITYGRVGDEKIFSGLDKMPNCVINIMRMKEGDKER